MIPFNQKPRRGPCFCPLKMLPWMFYSYLYFTASNFVLLHHRVWKHVRVSYRMLNGYQWLSGLYRFGSGLLTLEPRPNSINTKNRGMKHNKVPGKMLNWGIVIHIPRAESQYLFSLFGFKPPMLRQLVSSIASKKNLDW